MLDQNKKLSTDNFIIIFKGARGGRDYLGNTPSPPPKKINENESKERRKKICSIDPICLKQKVQFPNLLNNVDGTSVNDCKARPRPVMAVV